MTSYVRVLPRDLFNESALTKCVGKLWIATERSSRARFLEEDVPAFDIVQDQSSGGIEIANLTFEIDGVRRRLVRPLNAADSWSLYLEGGHDEDFDSVRVFDADGRLTEEMSALVS